MGRVTSELLVSLLLFLRTVVGYMHTLKRFLGKPPLSRCIPLRNQIVLDHSVVEKHQRATQPTQFQEEYCSMVSGKGASRDSLMGGGSTRKSPT